MNRNPMRGGLPDLVRLRVLSGTAYTSALFDEFVSCNNFIIIFQSVHVMELAP